MSFYIALIVVTLSTAILGLYGHYDHWRGSFYPEKLVKAEVVAKLESFNPIGSRKEVSFESFF